MKEYCKAMKALINIYLENTSKIKVIDELYPILCNLKLLVTSPSLIESIFSFLLPFVRKFEQLPGDQLAKIQRKFAKMKLEEQTMMIDEEEDFSEKLNFISVLCKLQTKESRDKSASTSRFFEKIRDTFVWRNPVVLKEEAHIAETVFTCLYSLLTSAIEG
jgi:hypothetical protein